KFTSASDEQVEVKKQVLEQKKREIENDTKSIIICLQYSCDRTGDAWANNWLGKASSRRSFKTACPVNVGDNHQIVRILKINKNTIQ
ncbi:hypothetical protein T4B_13233, partial [Trichinella pseudospiralis]